MGLNSIKHIDIKKNFGFIIFMLCINAYIVMSWHSIFQMQLPYESTSSFNIDGADFSIIANAFGSIFNSILFLINVVMNFILTFVIILVATIVFNKLYFKNRVIENLKILYSNIKIITIIFAICTAISIMLLNRNLARIFGLLFYIPFPIMVYFLTKGKIRKANN